MLITTVTRVFLNKDPKKSQDVETQTLKIEIGKVKNTRANQRHH